MTVLIILIGVDAEFCGLYTTFGIYAARFGVLLRHQGGSGQFSNWNTPFIPKSAVLPRIREEPVVIETLPASRLLTISSSLPWYDSFRFFESKSNVASVLYVMLNFMRSPTDALIVACIFWSKSK